MAKHDQRILKFLNQNADRAPTITEMMTRLNISISDISDSLGSLQAQGLIAKKTNNQGIECWFPTGPQAAPQMAQPVQVPAPHLATQQMPTTSIPLVGDRSPSERSGMDSRFVGGLSERAYQAPDPQPPIAKAPPVQVHHIPMAETSYAPSSRGGIPSQPEPALNGNAPMYGLSQPAPKGGIGFLTFALGLVVAVAVATWLSGRLAGNAVNAAARNFVDKKALTEATASFTEFQEKTKTHVTALEAEVKKLTDQLATSKTAADSLKTVAAAKPEPAKAVAVKSDEAPKSKAAKKTSVAKVKGKAKADPAMSAMAKAAARGAARRKKAMASGSASGSDPSSSSSEASPSESAPSVPEAPGLEDLPPPPSE